MERGRKRFEDLCPAFAGAVGVVGPVGVEFLRQGKLATVVERADIDRDAAHVRFFAGRAGAPGECEMSRTVELQVFAGVVDLLALASDEERERAADSRID